MISNKSRAFLPYLEKIDLALALLVVFLLPIYHWILPPIIILWIVVRIFQISTEQVSKPYRYDWLLLIPILLLFLNYAIGIIYSQDVKHAMKQQETMLSILVLPLLFFSASKLYRTHAEKFHLGFIFGCITAMILCFVFAFHHSLNWADGSLIFDRYIPGEQLDQNVPQESYFRYSNLSFSHHPFYLSIYLIFSIVASLRLLQGKMISSNFLKAVIIGSMPLFIVSLYLLSSKAALIIFILTMILFGILYLRKGKYLIPLLATLIILGVIGLTNSRFYYFKRLVVNYGQFNEYMVNKEYDKAISGYAIKRPVYWAIALEQIKQAPLFGVGTGDADDIIQALYLKYDLESAAKLKHNSHNQYLETTLSLGFVGLITLLSTLIIPFIVGVKRKNYELIMFIMLFTVASLFESMLNRFGGVAFFAYFYGFLLFVWNRKIVTFPEQN